MIRTVKIFEIGKKFFSKKIKVMARDGWIYDFERKMGFQNKNYWKEFINKIQKAVKNYNIIYRVNSKDQKVYILYIFYSKRNYLKFI